MKRLGISLLVCGFFFSPLWRQVRLRIHTAIQAGTLRLVPASVRPPAESEATVRKRLNEKVIEANGIPDHLVGSFPNQGNPNPIREQAYEIKVPDNPQMSRNITYMMGSGGRPIHVFGITLDGVFFEPYAGEFWQGNRQWQYEPLGGAINLGLDENHAHVQPTGLYHYHGIPTGLMKRLGFRRGEHSPLIGWAADGFPIYARYGYTDPLDAQSAITDLRPSYQLIPGDRPSEPYGPGGRHDGAFVRDYRFVDGSGNLDECNGRFCVTPEFPEGTYAYFLTEAWPVIPRAFRGEPVDLKEQANLAEMGPGGGGSRGNRPGPRPGAGPPPGGPKGFPPPFGGKGKRPF